MRTHRGCILLLHMKLIQELSAGTNSSVALPACVGLRIAEAREWKTFSLKNTRLLPRRYNDILSNSGNSSLPMWSEIKIIETWCYWSCRLPLLVKERKEQIVQRKVSGFSLSCRSDMNSQKRRKYRKENLKDSSIIK